MMYLGDYISGTTIDFMWSTNGADGASITRATNGTVSVYKANNTTQTTTGVTDTEDFDSLTGIHHCRIATTDGFYAVANDYMVVLSAATIDGKTVNAVLAMFSIENRNNKVNLTHIGGSAVSTSTAQLGVNVVNAAGTAWGSGAITSGAFASGAITATAIAADAIGASELAADAVAEIADAVWDEARSGHTSAGSFGQYAPANVTTWNGTAVGTPHTAGYPVVTVKDGTGTGEIDTTSGSVAVNVAQIAGSTGAATAAGKAFQGIVYGTAVTGTLTTTTFTTDLTEATNDHYNGRTVTFISGALAGQQATITDYTGATKLLTVSAMTEAPGNGDQFFIA